MESSPNGSALPPADDVSVERKQLPPGGNRIERLTQHSKSLVDEITHWAELKIKLIRVDLEEKVDAVKIKVALGAAMGLLAFFGVLFLLTTIALGLGAWLGHPAWGFLIVTVLLFAMVLIIKMMMPRLVAKIEKKAEVDESRLSYRVSRSEEGRSKSVEKST
jgi:hypothetical protein